MHLYIIQEMHLILQVRLYFKHYLKRANCTHVKTMGSIQPSASFTEREFPASPVVLLQPTEPLETLSLGVSRLSEAILVQSGGHLQWEGGISGALLLSLLQSEMFCWENTVVGATPVLSLGI